MNGEISFVSQLGVGTTFTIKLLDVEIFEQKDAKNPIAINRNSQRKFICDKLLIVDDVPLNNKVLAAMTKKYCNHVETANSGEEALELLKEYKPDLILSDMWMPKMSGSDLAAQIRAIPQIANVKIFAITADTEIDKFSTAPGLFDGILYKPISLDVILNAIGSTPTLPQ